MSHLSRRRFLQTGTALIGGISLAPNIAKASIPYSHKTLSFRHLHTGETLKNVTFWENGTYIDHSLDEINHLMRDFRTQDKHPIDPDLLSALHHMHSKLDTNQPFEIISAYRSPKTNAMLRGKSKGVAKKSFHMTGKAIDIRIQGVELDHLRNTAIALKKGGVGYYKKSNFVHIDTGRVRQW